MNFRKVSVLIIIILASFVIIFLQITPFKKGEENFAERFADNIFAPVQVFFTGVGKRISSTWHSIVHIANLEREVKKLQAELYALKEERELYERTQQENKQLRKLLGISRKEKGKVIAAEVIARDPDNWFHSIKVNKGYKNGVKKGMAVLSSEGVVGKVIDASKYTAKVRLIFDQRSSIPAQILPTGELGVVYGEGKNTCVMKYIDAKAPVEVGQQVVTSKLSRIFPPGKSIGTVSKIYGRERFLYQSVQIKPSVQFSNLEYVLLVGRE